MSLLPRLACSNNGTRYQCFPSVGELVSDLRNPAHPGVAAFSVTLHGQAHKKACTFPARANILTGNQKGDAAMRQHATLPGLGAVIESAGLSGRASIRATDRVKSFRPSARRVLGYVLCSIFVFLGWSAILGWAVDPLVLQEENERLAVIEKLTPSVVAVFDRNGRGGGSGVLIDEQGYALTNFHVVRPTGPTPRCGLSDGQLYDAVVVGLDPVGDVALIKLIPPKPDHKFPYAPLGDSDTVRAGDWSIAAGNPFLLATDFRPTITFGLVSGIHRYQYPAGTILEYTDCIQIDTSINPGNSGGPLFNLRGEVIGINGRGSFEKRGRVNSGVGYAISINQIKNFLGHLRGGLVVDHATLGAAARTDEQGRAVVFDILERSDAYRRGLRAGDVILALNGRPIGNANQFKNVLGIFPKGWRIPVLYERFDQEQNRTVRREILVRLMGLIPREVSEKEEDEEKPRAPREPKPPEKKPAKPQLPGRPVKPEGEGAKYYVARPGFGNYYFNEQERKRVVSALPRPNDLDKGQVWVWKGEAELYDETTGKPVRHAFTVRLDGRTVRLSLGPLQYEVEPLRVGEAVANLRQPAGSGGLLVALHYLRTFLAEQEKGFEQGLVYGGYEPFYPDGTSQSRIMTEVLHGKSGPFEIKIFCQPHHKRLCGLECYVEEDADPCELIFSPEMGPKPGVPARIEVRFGDRRWATLHVQQCEQEMP
jgi:serine protease Do